MNNIDKINAVTAAARVAEVQEQVNEVKKSNLTDEEKQKALVSHDKMVKTTIIVVIAICILMTVGIFVGINVGSALIMVLSMLVAVVLIITYVIIGKKRLFSDWAAAYEKVDNGFDGLLEGEINRLKPQSQETEIIKSYQKKNLKYSIIFLLALIIEVAIILSLDVPVYSPITIVITVIIIVIWYIKSADCRVEIHRIKSGYYKKGIGYICSKCHGEVMIKFEEIEKYNLLPRDVNGILTINCPNCNNPVKFYNFDTELKSYKDYLDKIK